MSLVKFELEVGKTSSDSLGLLLQPNFSQVSRVKIYGCFSIQEAEKSAPSPGQDGCSVWDVLLFQSVHFYNISSNTNVSWLAN